MVLLQRIAEGGMGYPFRQSQHDKQNSKAVVRAFAMIYNYRDDFAKVAETRLL